MQPPNIECIPRWPCIDIKEEGNVLSFDNWSYTQACEIEREYRGSSLHGSNGNRKSNRNGKILLEFATRDTEGDVKTKDFYS